MTEPIRAEFEGGLAVVTLHKPQVKLGSKEVIRAFNNVIDKVLASDARAVLTRSEGDVYCVGADINIYNDGERVRARRELSCDADLFRRIERLPMLTVAAIDGLCVFADYDFLLMHDIVLAAEGAKIGQIEAKIGDARNFLGNVRKLASRCGIARAKEIMFSGNAYPVETLESWNVVNKVLPSGGFNETALKYVRCLVEALPMSHPRRTILPRRGMLTNHNLTSPRPFD